MEASSDPRAVVEALAKHEEALSALYAAFAEAFPQVDGLWRTMSREEYGHAGLLRPLCDKVEDLQSFSDARRFELNEITKATGRVLTVLKIVPSGAFPLQEAFHAALKFEDAMIDGSVLVATEDDSPAVAKVLNALEEQTKRHRAHLGESLASYSGKI
jgi:rubrerythrin